MKEIVIPQINLENCIQGKGKELMWYKDQNGVITLAVYDRETKRILE